MDCSNAAAQWLSAFLGVPARLVRQSPSLKGAQRSCKLGTAGQNKALSFANESQFLIVSEESMATVNRYAEKEATSTIDRFRGNLIIRGAPAFAEDEWQGHQIRLGSQVLQVIAPCQRCQMVCVNQATAERTKEPLLALSKFRRHKGRTFFGQHAVHLGSESKAPFMLRLGCTIEILGIKQENVI